MAWLPKGAETSIAGHSVTKPASCLPSGLCLLSNQLVVRFFRSPKLVQLADRYANGLAGLGAMTDTKAEWHSLCCGS